MPIAAIGLGSNLGDRTRNLQEALAALGRDQRCLVRAVSSSYETEPVGAGCGGPFLNGAVLVETGLDPAELLEVLQGIEHALGRTRDGDAPTARVIDLDLLVCGQEARRDPCLVLPHPRMLGRRFVLAPLAEIAPDLVIPGSGLTVRGALECCVDPHWVRRTGHLTQGGSRGSS